MRASASAGGVLCVPTRCKASPSQRKIFPNLASQIRTAFCSMASNTGWRSPGELLMTWSTSDVAVCCSSEFAQFVEQPRVLDGDHRLVGEGFHQLNLLVAKRSAS